MEEPNWKLMFFDPTDEHLNGSFAAYSTIPDTCQPAKIELMQKCWIPYTDENGVTKRFLAQFIYEGTLDDCSELKDLLEKKKITRPDVIALNGNAEKIARVLNPGRSSNKNGRPKRRAKSEVRTRTKKIRNTSRNDVNIDSLKTIIEEGEKLVKRAEKAMKDTEEEVTKMEEKAKKAEENHNLSFEAAQTARTHAHAALAHLDLIHMAYLGTIVTIEAGLNTCRETFRQFELTINEQFLEDVQEVEDPRVTSVRRACLKHHEKALKAEAEEVVMRRQLEEANENLNNAKTILTQRKQHLEEIQSRFHSLEEMQRGMCNILCEMADIVEEDDEVPKEVEENARGSEKDKDKNRGDDDQNSGAITVGNSRSTASGNLEQLTRDGLDELPGSSMLENTTQGHKDTPSISQILPPR